MARIAHLSDLHLLEETARDRTGADRLRVQYLSLSRRIDPAARRTRAATALAAARAAGCDHLVLTGDLTEDGAPGQFDVLSEVLASSGIPPERITLCPGNHDAYGMPWAEALDGPLAPWAPASRAAVWLDDAVVLPVSTAVPQSYLRSGGRVEAADLAHADGVARDEAGRVVLLALHHPPFAVMHHWAHGLVNHRAVIGLLEARPNVSVLHGHIHRRRERGLRAGDAPRIFSPTAVADHDAPLRIYDVADGLLVPVPMEPTRASA